MCEIYKCAAGHVGNLSANCIGTNPREDGYRCDFCLEVVARYARTGANIRARRNSVTSMVGVKRAHEIQRGWSERAQIIVQDLFIDSLKRKTAKPPPLALVMCGSIQRKEACPYSDVDCFALVSRDEDVDVVKRAAHDVQNQLEVVGTASEGTEPDGRHYILHDGFHFCHGGLSPEKMCATPEGMINFIQAEAGANAHVLDALGGTFFYGKFRLYNEFAERVKVLRAQQNATPPQQKALDSLKKYLADENRDKKYRVQENLTFTIIKDRLYRPVQQVVKGVAQFYGITEVETRLQVQRLSAQGKLSRAVFNFLETYLNDVANLRVANHKKWGREYELVYLQNPARPSIEEAELIREGKLPLATGTQKVHVNKLMTDSEAIRDLGNEFVRQQSKTGFFTIKKNPFMTSNPHEFS